MGCDIHLFVEVKINGKWHNYNHPDVPRNYALFSKMANVRNDMDGRERIEPISSPRGIPDDVSEIVRYELKEDEGDAHSGSYLTPLEIVELARWMNEKWGKENDLIVGEYFGCLFGLGFEDFQHLPDFLEGFRFVFWFDN